MTLRTRRSSAARPLTDRSPTRAPVGRTSRFTAPPHRPVHLSVPRGGDRSMGGFGRFASQPEHRRSFAVRLPLVEQLQLFPRVLAPLLLKLGVLEGSLLPLDGL